MKRTKGERVRLISKARLLDLNGWSAPDISRRLDVPEITVRRWLGEVISETTGHYVGPVCVHSDEASVKEKAARTPYYQRLVKQKLPLAMECVS